jgi:hypothetical protein
LDCQGDATICAQDSYVSGSEVWTQVDSQPASVVCAATPCAETFTVGDPAPGQTDTLTVAMVANDPAAPSLSGPSNAISVTLVGGYWNPPTYPGNDDYTCIKIGTITLPTTSVSQAGACVTVNSSTDAVCCSADFNVSGLGWQIDYFDGGTYHTGASGASPTFVVGDFIGIHHGDAHSDATHFQCLKATAAAPTRWTDVSGSQAISGISSNGNPGLYSFAGDSNNIQGNDVWEGGTGSLPTGHTCGQ